MKDKQQLIILCLLWLFSLLPQSASAAPRRAESAPQSAGIEFKAAASGNVYTVLARPNATPSSGGQTLTAQITVRAPHGEGANRVEVSDLQSLVDGVFWYQRSRTDTPQEDPEGDYISFEYDYMLSDLGAIHWQAGQEVALFSFTVSGGAGQLGLMENCSGFMAPNSANTNPGNQIAVKGLDINNAYIGNYDVTVETKCSLDLYLPVITRQ